MNYTNELCDNFAIVPKWDGPINLDVCCCCVFFLVCVCVCKKIENGIMQGLWKILCGKSLIVYVGHTQRFVFLSTRTVICVDCGRICIAVAFQTNGRDKMK